MYGLLSTDKNPELIEEVAGDTDLKFRLNAENVVTRNKTSDICTYF